MRIQLTRLIIYLNRVYFLTAAYFPTRSDKEPTEGVAILSLINFNTLLPLITQRNRNEHVAEIIKPLEHLIARRRAHETSYYEKRAGHESTDRSKITLFPSNVRKLEFPKAVLYDSTFVRK